MLFMIFRLVCGTKENILKLKIYLLKIIVILFGVFVKKVSTIISITSFSSLQILENSFPIFLIHHKLRSLSGMKIFTFIRIIEFFNILLNKFNKDYDLQLMNIVRGPKLKKKVVSLAILLISMCLNIVTLWSYMISLSIVLNDPNNFIYPLIMKMNYVEMKKSGKTQKKKKFLELIFYEVYDRFFVMFSVLLVIIQNYCDNKINSHNFVDYSYRVFFLVASEVLFDWIKHIIVFKISELKPNLIKQLTLEMAIFHDRLRFKSYNSNGANTSIHFEDSKYLKLIEREKLKFINKTELHKYSGFLDLDSILCIQMQNNILIYSIIILSFVYEKFHICTFKIIFLALVLLLLRKLLQCTFTNYILEYILSGRKKLLFPSSKSVTSLTCSDYDNNSDHEEHGLTAETFFEN